MIERLGSGDDGGEKGLQDASGKQPFHLDF